MDSAVVYADLHLARTGEPKRESPPPLSPDTCQCPRWHRLALKLGCACLILLVLSVIGLGVLVLTLLQKPPVQNSSADVQEDRINRTDSPAKLKCPEDWLPHRDKCFHVSETSKPWKESLADCDGKEATLLLIQDQEELRYLRNLTKGKDRPFWIGLNYTLSDRNWKWINGSTLNSDVLNISGDTKEDSCASVSQDKVLSESCVSDNLWICQKELRRECTCNGS